MDIDPIVYELLSLEVIGRGLRGIIVFNKGFNLDMQNLNVGLKSWKFISCQSTTLW